MSWFDWFRSLLVHPLLRGVDIHDLSVTNLRREILHSNRFFRQICQEWYQALSTEIPEGTGSVLEIGSGAGFLRDYIPSLITSEVFYSSLVQVILNGNAIPFAVENLRGIVMNNVLHHVAQPRRFFAEAARCVRPGGVVTCLEPWMTSWSRSVYRHVYHEPIHPEAMEWDIPSIGPLSGANIALPWIFSSATAANSRRNFPAGRLRRSGCSCHSVI